MPGLYGPSVRSPRHLWSGDWRSQSEAARAQREREGAIASEAATSDHARASEATETAPAVRDLARADSHAGPPHPPPDGAAEGVLRRRPSRRVLLGAGMALALAAVGAVTYFAGSRSASHDVVGALPALPAGPLPATHGQSRAGAIYALASPAVVSIRTAAGSGAGFVIDRGGTIVTNAHVVVSATRVTVAFGSTGRLLTGTVIGADPSSDLAVVRIDPASEPSGVKPLGLADSRGVRVGDPVIAIGNPFGLDRTETAGIVSGLGRTIAAPNGFDISGAIQTDAAINPGNSGGPLLDDTGRVVGVNSEIETGGTSQGNIGIGFAVPSNSIRQVIPVLERGQTISRPWLGVSSSSSPSGGAVIASLVSGGPADKAGIQAGDLITSIDGQAIADSAALASYVASKQTGDHVHVSVTRGGQIIAIDVQLGARPAQVP
jgi:putative serine protease PepD